MFSTKEGRVESIETVPATENDPIKQPYYITNSHTAMNENKVQELQDVVIRFSGDSGDGMQLTGTLFSDTSALLGNGISTFPDYPAEIRAPQGTVAGVSGFQVHFGAKRQLNPGDFCDVLIAMNPAALKANRKWLKPGATVILDEDSITEEHLRKAGFPTLDPIRELNLEDFNVVVPNITEMTKAALADSGLDNKAMVKCKNMFALGICFYLYNRPEDHAKHYLDSKFAKKNPAIAEANKRAIDAGYNYAANTHQFANTYTVASGQMEKGTYRSISGNVATAWGLCAASEKSGLPLFCGSYPITPATVILEELAKRKDLGVKTVQAEDEIAGICTAIGASFAGNFAVTTTSGPGLSLKSEALGLAVMTELPLVVVDVQRGGPSTGLPTKTEQSDLQQALYGRGLSYRHGAHDAGSASLGRIHRQRFRTVEDPFDEGLPDHQPADHRQNRGRRPFHALRPQREAGTQLGIPRQSRSGAPCRRTGERQAERQYLDRPTESPGNDEPACRENRQDRRLHPAPDGLRRPGRRSARSRLGRYTRTPAECRR